MHTIKWNLRYEPKSPISFRKPAFYNPFAGTSEGTLIEPGTYSASLDKIVNGEIHPLAGPSTFNVKSLKNTVMPAEDRSEKVAFQNAVSELSGAIDGIQRSLGEFDSQLRYINEAIKRTEKPMAEWYDEVNEIKNNIREVRLVLNGDRVARTLDIDQPPSVSGRIGWLMYEQFYSTAAPTKTHRDSYAIAKEEFEPIVGQVAEIQKDLTQLQEKLKEGGAPYIPGRKVEVGKQ